MKPRVATGAPASETVVYEDKVYGDRATLQVPRRDLDRVTGKFQEVDPATVGDMAQRQRVPR